MTAPDARPLSAYGTVNALVASKQLLKEKLSAFEQKANNRFELTEKFLKTNITNAELANEGIPEELLREFKKVGSNYESPSGLRPGFHFIQTA